MPSDSKKKRDQKKKEALKKHDVKKPAPKTNGNDVNGMCLMRYNFLYKKGRYEWKLYDIVKSKY